MAHLILLTFLSLPLLTILRVYLLLPASSSHARPFRRRGSTCSLAVFLGSGGHTAEMKTLLSTIDFERYTPRVYVYCHGDELSLRAVSELESGHNLTTPSTFTLLPLPRARRVAQPLLSTVFTTLHTLILTLYHTFFIRLFRRPTQPWVDVLILNGPGTCVPLVLVAWIRRVLGLRYTTIIYVESFARVRSLSLSGRLVRPFVDSFVVQWPDAAGVGRRKGRSRVKYRGWLV